MMATTRANMVQKSIYRLPTQARVFSTGLGDLADVTKVNYTVEFDQGLSEEEKS